VFPEHVLLHALALIGEYQDDERVASPMITIKQPLIDQSKTSISDDDVVRRVEEWRGEVR
jgi:hypothetical protein